MKRWGVIPPERRFKEYLIARQLQPARSEHPCALVACGRKIEVEELMRFLLDVADMDPEIYTGAHEECYQALPDRDPANKKPEAREVYVYGMKEKAEGLVEYLHTRGEQAWFEELPPGERHRGRKYVVLVRPEEGQEGQLAFLHPGAA